MEEGLESGKPETAGAGGGGQQQIAQTVEDLGGGVALEMVWIPGGKLAMGTPPSEQRKLVMPAKDCFDESPQTDVAVSGLWMGKTVVTQEQYERLVGTNPSKFKESKNPVETVSWNDAMEFCGKLSSASKAGRTYSLPTEAQWEYACRAGTTTPFSFGATISTDQANYNGTYIDYYGVLASGSGPRGENRQRTVAADSFAPNAFGLYNMHGNVWEWCLSLYKPYPYQEDDGRNDPNGSEARVLRGGAWSSTPYFVRSASRNSFGVPTNRYPNSGFRVVCLPSNP